MKCAIFCLLKGIVSIILLPMFPIDTRSVGYNSPYLRFSSFTQHIGPVILSLMKHIPGP